MTKDECVKLEVMFLNRISSLDKSILTGRSDLLHIYAHSKLINMQLLEKVRIIKKKLERSNGLH